MFTSILQQTRLPGHNPYRGFIIPSPEMVTIPFGSHNDISTQMQFGSPVVGVVEDVDGTVGNVIVGRVAGGVIGVPVTFRG